MNNKLLILGVILLLILLIWGYQTQGWFRTAVPATGAPTGDRTIKITLVETTAQDRLIYEEEKALVTELNTARLTEERRTEITNRLNVLYGSGNTKTGHYCCTNFGGNDCRCSGFHCCRRQCNCTNAY